MEILTCVAPVNIATIKYWGKRDEDLILPLNDSVSVTLSTDHMHAKTTVALSPDFQCDKLWLNGVEQQLDSNARFIRLIMEIRKRANLENKGMISWKVHICSENNFPTAAGLASSAAGYACLVYALAQIYKVNGDISTIARLGSGSACRSVFGGFVQWQAGNKPDGSDSFAEQLFPANHWPELHVLILVVNEGKKKVASTAGMQLSVKTSELLQYRVREAVPKHIERMIKAIKEKNFSLFAEITMQDSNQMHATAMDSYPPIFYMNSVSQEIVTFVHEYNRTNGVKVAYTFDAGPNACLFLLEKDLDDVFTCILNAFPNTTGADDYIRGIPFKTTQKFDESFHVGDHNSLAGSGALKYIIHTKVGDGPFILEDQNTHLLTNVGLPKFISSS